MIHTRPDAPLFWKAPLYVDTTKNVTVEIAPPHYLAYVPPAIWVNGTGGVDVDPWVTRKLHISPCEDGARQQYFGGFLVSQADSCLNVTVTSEQSESATIRFRVGTADC